MTRSFAGTGMSSSSPQSLGDFSHHDTPSTNLTAFSPDVVKDVDKVIASRFKVSITSANEGDAVGSEDGKLSEHDPFTVPTPTPARSALSPTATSFTPGEVKDTKITREPVLTASGRISTACVVKVPGEAKAAHGRARTSHGAIGEPSPPQALVDAFRQLSLGGAAIVDQDGHYRFSSIMEGSFTSEEISQRAFKVSVFFGKESLGHLQMLFNTTTYPSFCGVISRSETAVETLLVSFSDIRDAVKAFEDVRKGHWAVTYLNPKALGFEITGDFGLNGPFRTISNYEGQLKAQILFNPQNPALTSHYVIPLIKDVLSKYGEVKAIHSDPCAIPHVKAYRIEFYDTRSTTAAQTALNNKDIGYEISIKLEPNRDDAADPMVETVPRRHVEQPSITGRSTVPMNDPVYNSLPAIHYMDYNRPAQGGFGHAPAPNHNQVDIIRIRLGLDVRTTIMLRNIPNRIDQAMLKAILDETSFGKYDFMYLRIDFANNCNVGYAFVNFEDPISIIDFATARAGRRWNRFSSDKVAEISYATIQGKDCLVQKFRNSSVMLEHPTFRPKIYITGTGPDAGSEEKFPGPDNPSKMRRSVENAETVGLFAPRHGQQFRDDQRRRRSQYDRGTTAAEMEARHEGIYDPARDPRTFGAPRFGRTPFLPYY
ncbi:hypothetical protein GJ744_000461 [Endocarpon pusillum]|uniref:RRM domain-containing protein n=1 Tax=Endocarpon pusillum TaxID=364733 RepID=A0A8H7AIJ3_9EURO|nr:hypothetical protein GJ744_000461 [Endocarpon pusillum]